MCKKNDMKLYRHSFFQVFVSWFFILWLKIVSFNIMFQNFAVRLAIMDELLSDKYIQVE